MLGKRRMLFVEDERDIVSVFSRRMPQFGYIVDAYTDPVKALLNFRAGSYDLALLYIRMPNLNGIELARRLVQQDPLRTIFFWSANEYDERQIRERLPTLSIDFFIQKPKTISEVVRHIEAHFEPDRRHDNSHSMTSG